MSIKTLPRPASQPEIEYALNRLEPREELCVPDTRGDPVPDLRDADGKAHGRGADRRLSDKALATAAISSARRTPGRARSSGPVSKKIQTAVNKSRIPAKAHMASSKFIFLPRTNIFFIAFQYSYILF
jgi:hypothetical protein